MAAIKTKALVIREQDFSEQDKILTLFTENEGKQKAIAKGVRRTKNSLTAATQLFSYGEFVYFPGKNFANISQATLIESFYPLRQNIEKMTLGSCVLELLDAFFDFYQGNAALLKVANYILYYISENMSECDLALFAAFQLKCSKSQGIQPVLTQCAHCHGKEDLLYFGIDDGGAMCKNCSNDFGITYKMKYGQLELMRFLLSTPINKIKSETFDEKIILAICEMMERYIASKVDKKLSAFQFYREIKNS